MEVNKIFCALPIFAPSKKLFERNKKSIVSFVEYLKLNSHYLDGSKGFLLDIYYGGWSVSDEYWNDLKNYIKINIPTAKVFRFDKNYGKAKVVNDLCFEYSIDNKDTQFLFSCDSDMQFINDQVHFFDRLFLAAKCIQDLLKKPFGLISLNQKDACYHWYEPKNGAKGMDQKASYNVNGSGMNFDEELVWPSDGCGIAGGGLFINFKLFKLIGGYRRFNAEYCGDDGLLLRDLQQNGASATIIKTLSLIHPQPEDDQEYLKWKEECMKEAFVPFDDKKYQENLKKSEQLWDKISK